VLLEQVRKALKVHTALKALLGCKAHKALLGTLVLTG
jgi:hypothetical protein